jgi:hypothetical protein
LGRLSDKAYGGEYAPPSNDPLLPRTPNQITRAGNPSTSYQAASAVVGKLRPLQQKVLDVHLGRPDGLTDLSLEEQCGSHGSTYRTRRAELTELGLIVDSGRKAKQQGSNRTIWIAARFIK